MTCAVTSLSQRLRDATREAHERAESAPFVTRLLAGEYPLEAYAGLVAQNHAVYVALEAVTPRWAGDPVGGPFVCPELLRREALERDLATLLGRHWTTTAATLVQPATIRYAAALHESAGTDAAAFVAHHYVRYLGDLSGGQIVARRVAEVFGAPGRAATAFYSFDAIARIKPYRDDYRARLDAAPLDAAGRDRLVGEARRAFAFNTEVFLDLGRWADAL